MENPLTQMVRAKFVALKPLLDERTRRRWAATEARAIGRGGITWVAEATGMSRTTIKAGIEELDQPLEDGRIRGPGGGRKPLAEQDPNLLATLEKMVDPVTRGNPSGPLRWTCSSASRLADELRAAGHPVSERTVRLHEAGYSLQANRKTLEGNQHPDRDAQFKYINRRVKAFQRLGEPIVSGEEEGTCWKISQ